jgi:hypothetical protein
MFFLDTEERCFYLLDVPVLTSNDIGSIVIGGQKVGYYQRHIMKDRTRVLTSAMEFFHTGTIDIAKPEWEEI